MVAYNIQFGHGIDIGAGITVGNAFTFTLTSADFTNFNNGSGLTNVTNSSFTVLNNTLNNCNYGPDLGSANGGNQTFYDNLLAAWAAAGLTINGNSYPFNVTWGAGGSPSSTVAVVSLYNYNATEGRLVLAPVYTGNNDWQSSVANLVTLLSAPGDYNLPITFTLISPPIQDADNWC
jgi:hypothetical protein